MTLANDRRGIELQSLTHFSGKWTKRSCLYDNINATFLKNSSYIIFATAESKPRVLLNLLGGYSRPSKGRIMRYGSVSPLIGTATLPFYSHTVREAIALVAQVYDVDFQQLLESVRLFIGDQDLDTDLVYLSPEEKSNLSFGLGYSVWADFYLLSTISPAPSRSSPTVLKRCVDAFESRRQTSSTIIVSSSTRNARNLADVGGVIHNGRLTIFKSVADAIEEFEKLTDIEARSVLAMVRSLAQKGQVDEARRLLESAAAAPELRESPRDALAEAYFLVGDIENALKFAEEARSAAPASVPANLLLARVADRAGDHHAAASSALEVVRADREHRLGRLLLARNLEKLSKYQTAADVWRTLAQSDKGSSLRSLIQCQVKAEDYAGALDSIEQIPAEFRYERSIVFVRFECIWRTKDISDIVAEFVQISKINGDDAILIIHRNINFMSDDTVLKLSDVVSSSRVTGASARSLDIIIRHLRSGRLRARGEVLVEEVLRVADQLESLKNSLQMNEAAN